MKENLEKISKKNSPYFHFKDAVVITKDGEKTNKTSICAERNGIKAICSYPFQSEVLI